LIAQSSAFSAAIDLFRDLEDRLLQPDIRRSFDEIGPLLAADFLEFGASGAIYDRQHTIEGLANEQLMERSLTNFAIRSLAENVTLVTYHAVRRDPASGREWHSLRSSIWKLIDGRWQLTFHQGTPTAPP